MIVWVGSLLIIRYWTIVQARIPSIPSKAIVRVLVKLTSDRKRPEDENLTASLKTAITS